MNIMKAYKKPDTLPKYGSLASILKEIGTNKDILDVGCSEGYLAELNHGANNRMWGIDFNPEAVEKARSHYEEVKLLDLNYIPEKRIIDQYFDVIVFADVLEHLLYPDQVLSYFKQFLKPGGKVIVSLPNVALWRIRMKLLFGIFTYVDYGVLDRTHLHLFTFQTAKHLLMANGFKINNIRGAANLLGPVVRYFPFLKGLFSIHIIITATVK